MRVCFISIEINVIILGLIQINHHVNIMKTTQLCTYDFDLCIPETTSKSTNIAWNISLPEGMQNF